MERLTHPFRDYSRAWNWFKRSGAFLNSRTSSLEQFTEWASRCDSWAVEWEEPIGIWLVEPVSWPGSSTPTDAYITLALDRKAWGRGVFERCARPLVHETFTSHPTLRRLTAYTKATNAAAVNTHPYFGATLEGRLREAAPTGEDILIYGLTKDEFYEWTHHNHNEQPATV